jgi:hypothetical protein
MFRIKMQHHSCDFAPVSTLRIRVEQAQVRDHVLLVVYGQYGTGGRAASAWGRMAPELGSLRVADSEMYIRAQFLVIELLGGEVAERILNPDQPSRGAKHDFVEASAFARIVVAASPAVAALLAYCEAEATALIRANIEIVHALVEALSKRGILTGDEIYLIIARTISMQSVVEEKQRRADWQCTAKSAAKLQSGASPLIHAGQPCRSKRG